jgi:hypothetical protein
MMRDRKPNYINHIVMALDMSGSMWPHRHELIKVADGQVAHLARRSQELDQETRVTVYVVNGTAECVVYDKDVLRLPSIAEFYRPDGGTALIDATMMAISELRETPERYGDHAFLIYVLTDGEENSSRTYGAVNLTTCITGLRDHWTVAALVPNQLGKHEAKRFGFPPDNIAIWDASSAAGVSEVGATIREATERFMVDRAKGVRGSRSIFSTGADAVNNATVSALTPLDSSKYMLIPVTEDTPIRQWVEDCGLTYRVGSAMYQLTKTELIQHGKAVAIRNKKTGVVYSGPQARGIIGLPDIDVRVKPDKNPEYEIYITSTSVNRKLIAGTKLMYIV